MIGRLLRTLAGAVLTLLAATFITYLLVAYSGDPLAGLRTVPDPVDRAAQTAQRIEALNLDVPPPQRYLLWLRGVASCLVPGGGCTFGTNRAGEDVGVALGQALGVTVSLVLGAVLLAVLVGVVAGVVSALRADSLFDHGLGTLAIVAYSTPPFVTAVLVKEAGAIGLNTWLVDPRIPAGVVVTVALVNGVVWALALGGSLLRRLLVFGAAAGTAAVLLGYLSAVRWFADPALGPGAAAVATLAVGATGLALTGQFRRGPVLAVAGLSVLAAVVMVAGYDWMATARSWGRPALLTFALTLTGSLVGMAAGGERRLGLAAVTAATGAAGSLFVVVEHVLRALPAYRDATGGTVMPTFGDRTPGLQAGFWAGVLDQHLHLLLPALTLCLFSMATYYRYTRAGMLTALAADHVLTARAWGLPERQVVLGHGLRNAMLPVVTVVSLDLAAVFGGAVLVEEVFGWQGMGQLFQDGLEYTDPAPVMAFILVSGLALVVCTALSDLAYGLLDPRVTR